MADEEHEKHVGDMTAVLISDGSWVVYLGWGDGAPYLGQLYPTEDGLWEARRFHALTDVDGNVYEGEARPTEILGTASTVEEAIERYMGPSA